MKQIDFINIIRNKVRDDSENLFQESKIESIEIKEDLFSISLLSSTRTASPAAAFSAGDDVFINGIIYKIYSVDFANNKLTIAGQPAEEIPAGSVIIKTNASYYINEAIEIYSKFKGKYISKEYTVIRDNRISLDSNYNVVSVEYISDNKYYSLGWSEEKDKDGNYFILLETDVSGSVKIGYTEMYYFDDSGEIEIPSRDLNCICNIAIAYYLKSLSIKYISSINKVINADNVNHSDRVNYYLKLSDSYLQQAAAWMNVNFDDLKAGRAQSLCISDSQEYYSETKPIL